MRTILQLKDKLNEVNGKHKPIHEMFPNSDKRMLDKICNSIKKSNIKKDKDISILFDTGLNLKDWNKLFKSIFPNEKELKELKTFVEEDFDYEYKKDYEYNYTQKINNWNEFYTLTKEHKQALEKNDELIKTYLIQEKKHLE